MSNDPNALPANGVWSIDPMHSTVRFSLRHHAVATFRAGFSPVTGAYDAGAGTLAGEVRADTLLVPGIDMLRNHLLTPDFFDAESNPTFSFRSTSITADGAGGLQIDGDLTLRGVTRPVSATGAVRGPATVHQPDGTVTERIGIDLTATIDRRDFGISFNNEITEGVLNLGWDVGIDVALELVAPAGTA